MTLVSSLERANSRGQYCNWSFFNLYINAMKSNKEMMVLYQYRFCGFHFSNFLLSVAPPPQMKKSIGNWPQNGPYDIGKEWKGKEKQKKGFNWKENTSIYAQQGAKDMTRST
jgi:hypothetical protein